MSSPNSSPAAVPPTSSSTSPPPSPPSTSSPPPSPSINTSSPPPSTSSPPPDPSTTSPPPSQSRPRATADPPAPTTPSTPSPPPPQSPPPAVPSSPPPTPPPLPPPTPPPPASPPSPPPPALSPPPPGTGGPPPPASSSPSQPVSPPPPSQPVSPPPPTQPVSPSSPPPIPSPPPPNLPNPPKNSPPPPSANPPKNSPPPPSTANPPKNSPPPPPTANPPENSSPPPPPPRHTPPVPSGPRPASPPSPNPPLQSPLPLPSPSPPSSPVPPRNSPSGGTPSSPTPPSPGDPTGGNPSPSVPGTTNNSSSGGGINTGGAVAIGVVVGFILLSLIGLAVWFWRKPKKKADGYNGGYVMPSPFGSSPKSDTSDVKTHSSAPLVGSRSHSDFIYTTPSDPGGIGNSRSWFTYKELLEVTDGFSAQNLLGEGGFGCVYKGCLADGREVAVKQLKIGGAQGEREFRAEVEIISRVHHRHLVSLVGYCISDHHRLLVYDYVPNNTLYYHLHGEGRPVMDWATRTRVAAGAARGLAYLHEDCHPRIIHRDIKSSNILIDNNFEAQVSDFGLAKLALDTYTHVTTRVMGTFGYMAPEYASSGKLTEKSDVYSFGVVLLELITGRKPVDSSQPLGDESLVEWARPLLSHALENEEFEGLVDPRLEKNYVEIEMFRMIEAAAACVRHSAVKRPRMGQVVRALDSIGSYSDLSNGMRPGQSEIFDSAQQSAEIRMFRRMAFGSQEYSTDFFSENSSN